MVCPHCGGGPVDIEHHLGRTQPERLSVRDVVSMLHGAALTLGSAHGLIHDQPERAQQRVTAVIDTLDDVIVELRRARQQTGTASTGPTASAPDGPHLEPLREGGRRSDEDVDSGAEVGKRREG